MTAGKSNPNHRTLRVAQLFTMYMYAHGELWFLDSRRYYCRLTEARKYTNIGGESLAVFFIQLFVMFTRVKMERSKMHYRHSLLWRFDLKKSAAEAHQMLASQAKKVIPWLTINIDVKAQ